MATISLSPAPVHHLSAMSTRRVPLGNNPNVVNSPMRSHLAAAQAGKRLRSHADLQREEAYGHPPPAKRQMVEHNVQRPVTTAASQRTTRAVTQRQAAGIAPAVDRGQQSSYKPSEKEVENVRQWQAQTRSRFPKMVFYFESVPDDQRVKLAKHVTHLGAREEKFFSINITHVVTTRQIPTERSAQDENETVENQEQPKTIDPSLLHRQAQATADPLRRKLLFDTAASRRIPVPSAEDAVRKPKPRNTDVLHKARDMGKKIWSLEKLQKILDMVLEPDPYKSALLGQGQRNGVASATTTSKSLEGAKLVELLQHERVHGPSDTVAAKELHHFKGPYIYIYDIEEKQKPIMVREYPKVADKKAGEWPQFRVASQGRCPFVEDKNAGMEEEPRPRVKEQVKKSAATTRAELFHQVTAPRPVVGKRTLAEMEDGHNRGATTMRDTGVVESVKAPLDAFRENFFTSHGNGKAPRFVAGEPVASGVQPSKLTSAIRSNMISSTSGILGGVKAGTSKEIHGLQRQVLQKHSTPAVSQDLSSRRVGDGSNAFIRSTSVARTMADKQGLDLIHEDDDAAGQRIKLRRANSNQSVTAPAQVKRKRDLKPGYCENCADKFDDFDDHILTKKHRKFAENNKNWEQLDDLLSQLRRQPKYVSQSQEEEEEW